MPKKTKIWREVFHTEENTIDYKMLHYHPKGFVESAAKSGASKALRDILIVVENGGAKRYEPVEQLEKFIPEILNKVVKNPTWALRLHKKSEIYGKKLFTIGKTISTAQLKKMSLRQLAFLNKKIVSAQVRAHLFANAIARIEAYDQSFSRLLNARLKAETKLSTSGVAELFSSFTEPKKISFSQQEKKELSAIAIQYGLNSKSFGSWPAKAKKKFGAHVHRWSWLGYGYIGPKSSTEFFLDQLKNVENSFESLEKYQDSFSKQSKDSKNKYNQLLQEHQISPKTKKLLAIARDLVWIKDFRKHCMFFACFCLDLVHQECARRLGISLEQVNFMSPSELTEALLTGTFDTKVLTKRKRKSIITYIDDTFSVSHGARATSFLKSISFENQTDSDFKGQCAYPGVIEGRVVIIKSMSDLVKVKDGDIMVTHTTFPSFLPAIYKASALLSESGGLTCHAAIVARELKKPTIVGIKGLLNTLHDGDKVRIDAASGQITRLRTSKDLSK